MSDEITKDYLTQREFDRYVESDNRWKNSLDDNIKRMLDGQEDHRRRLTDLELGHATIKKTSGGISALISAVTTGLVNVFLTKFHPGGF